jgi:probable F420-dependent oxidoreductase
MANLQFGVGYSDLEIVVDPPDLAQKYESLGYDSFWLPDHILKTRMDPLTVLAAVSQKTTRMKLGTAVSVLPYRHPYVLAKAAVTVDVLSHGRLILGVGIGDLFHEFEALEIDRKIRGRLSDERLEIVRRFFNEHSVTHKGQFHDFKDVALKPSAVQKPHIPIWIGADLNDNPDASYSHYSPGEFPGSGAGVIAKGSIRRTARFGDGFLPYLASLRHYKTAKEQIIQEAEAFGRDPSTIEWGLFLYMYLADTTREARDKAPGILQEAVGYTGIKFENAFAAGTPQDCIEVVEAYADLGITHFLLSSICKPADKIPQYEWIARDVLPHFKRN